MANSRVTHYEILELLGRGAMGEVYLARDLVLGRQAALKFLSPEYQKDTDTLERFMLEAKSVAALDHPNICTIYEVQTRDDGAPFIAMAYYGGETLRSKIDAGLLRPEEAVEYTVQILRGLGRAHERGIVHRDIKPSNIIVTPDGVVKVLDFGLAKLLWDHGKVSEAIAGTIPYMSPEQLAGKIDERSDLWATAVVLYEMLTGRLPFDGETNDEIVDSILTKPPANVRELRPGIPSKVARALERALEKNTKLRYQTARAMIEDLRTSSSSQLDTVLMQKSFAGLPVDEQERGDPSVAVLPFTNISVSEEASYFSDGLTEEVIHALSRLGGIRVVSRTSAFEFKGKAQDIRTIAAHLGVQNVLEGSVRLSGNKIRVTVLLTNASDGCSLWSQRFDRELSDVFSIQEEIATSVAMSLCEALTDESAARKPSPLPPANVDSWNLCLKARYHWHQARPESFEKARKLYEQAIEMDPQCSFAYAGLGDYYRTLAFLGIVDPRQAWPAARSFAAKAIELDPLRPQPHIIMARYFQHVERDRNAAEREFRRAISLNPGDSESHVAWGIFLVQAGQFDEALRELRLARDLDPLNLLIAVGVAWLHCYRGEYDQALTECLKARELNPNYLETFGCMAWISEEQGRIAEAESWHERGVAESGRSPIFLAMLGRHYALYGKTEKAREIVASLQELSEKRYVSPVALAFVLVAIGEMDKALDYLERAYEVHDGLMAYAKVYPPFAPFRGHPRFASILRGLGLTDEGKKSKFASR